MQFCTKCGALLIPKKEDANKGITCETCGTITKHRQNVLIKERVRKEKSSIIEVIDKKIDAHPKIKEKCPKCGNGTALYWTMQTRSGDEAETRFFECTKCQNRWRAYE